MNNNKKQALILSIIAVVTLIALVVGATYAYFKAQGGTGSSTEVKVTTYTTDMLTFTTGSAISLYADQSSFGQEKGSLSGETFAKATLVANNKTNEATDNYYVYFNIENNTFKYTLGEDKPELILTVTGPDGSEVTEISGLTHKVVQDRENKSISGFDVTTTNGLITIANKKTITATPNAEEQYTLKLTFVNYEGDQTENATSSLSAKVMIQKEPIVTTLASYITNLYTGTQGENGIYYHDASLTNGAGDNSYRFAGASGEVNNYVCFGSTTTPCPTDNLYRIIGVFGDKVKLIKSDYANSNLLGTDGDYSTDTFAKSSDLTYKGELTTINGYYWNNSTKTNTWSESNLNKVNLNTNFINNIRSKWAAKIAETAWKVGGNIADNIAGTTPSVVYQNEIVNPVTTNSQDNKTEYSAKIGLMYASDYMYAASQDKWTLVGFDRDASKDYRAATTSNWMYMGLDEWTISRNADYSYSEFSVTSPGYVYGDFFGGGNALAIRPVFYLTSSVNYASGSGSATDPILVN